MSNLSEEEKKAIEFLENFLREEMLPNNLYNSIRDVLNLIDKQQKELEDKNKVINLMATGILNIDKEIGQENNRENKIKQTSDEFTNETRYYTPEGEIYETIIETYKCPKNYISKDKIRGKIKELEKKIHVVTPDTHIIDKITEFKNEGALNILQELLEEE